MRFYRLLLRLYPASFRREYADELCAVFAARAPRGSGPVAAIARALAAVTDVVPNALAAHWDILRQDARFAARSLRRAPGFALTAVLVVALGVGANAAAFSLAGHVMLRPLPFPQPERLVKLWQRTPGYGQMELSPANYRDWKGASRSFDAMGAYVTTAMNLVGSGDPRRVQVVRATPDVFPLLGIRPLAGRGFDPADSSDAREVVLGYSLWQTQFGGDPGILGRVLSLDGEPYVVTGIMPADFRFPTRETDLWTPLRFRERDFEDRNDNYLQGVARLAPGVSLAQARSELATITARLEREYPKENARTGANVYRMSDELSERSRLLLYALCGAALCILLLACANIGNLLLARAVARDREIAVRAALGAGRERLVRQLLTESLGLTLLGGAAGVAVAIGALPMLARLVPNTLPIAETPSLDWRVLLGATALIVVTGVAFGVVPALRAGAGSGLSMLRDGGRSGGARQRVRAALVTVEIMASVVLVISAGLLVRAMWRLQAVDPGFRTENVLTLRTALPLPRYANPIARARFYDRVLGEVRALPGVDGAAYISFLPIAMKGGIWPVQVAGEELRRDIANTVSMRFTTPQFFRTMAIPIVRGRDVEASDDGDRPYVAVVSESFAERYWPGQDPLGQRFTIAFAERTVVGVVKDIRVRGVQEESEPQVYLPYEQVDEGAMPFYVPKDLALHATVPPTSLLPAIRRIVRAADAEQPISNVRTMAEIVREETASRAAQLRVLGILAAIALLLAGVGIHGVLSFAVLRRSREIGVRLALGAEPGGIVALVLREGLVLALLGIVPGVLVAYAAARGMGALLVGVQPYDPLTIAAGVAICGATVVLGCVRPAARAARVDPLTAIRAE